MRCRLVVIGALVFNVLLSARGFAYNQPGHMVSGAIAYAILKRDRPNLV